MLSSRLALPAAAVCFGTVDSDVGRLREQAQTLMAHTRTFVDSLDIDMQSELEAGRYSLTQGKSCNQAGFAFAVLCSMATVHCYTCTSHARAVRTEFQGHTDITHPS